MTSMQKIERRHELLPLYIAYVIDFYAFYHTHQELKHTLAMPVLKSFGSWLYTSEFRNESLWYQDNNWTPLY